MNFASGKNVHFMDDTGGLINLTKPVNVLSKPAH
jgi:hypothetical protein